MLLHPKMSNPRVEKKIRQYIYLQMLLYPKMSNPRVEKKFIHILGNTSTYKCFYIQKRKILEFLFIKADALSMK